MGSSGEYDDIKLHSKIMKPAPMPHVLLPLIELLSNSKFKIRRTGEGQAIIPLSLKTAVSDIYIFSKTAI